jgi:DNA modification methylase
MVNKTENEDKFRVYNKSSEDMKEVEPESADLVITDPPFNVGTCFGSKVDNDPHEKYINMMRNITSEIGRVLSPKGLALMLVPAMVKKGLTTYAYPKIYSSICNDNGLKLLDSFSYLVTEDDFDCVPMKEILKSDLSRKCHSEEIVGLVFSKGKQKINTFPQKRFYRYVPREGHPCPYPPELMKDLLDTFFRSGDAVIDPFMGTGSLGVEVLRRQGSFIGYELDRNFYLKAKRKCNGALKR